MFIDICIYLEYETCKKTNCIEVLCYQAWKFRLLANIFSHYKLRKYYIYIYIIYIYIQNSSNTAKALFSQLSLSKHFQCSKTNLTAKSHLIFELIMPGITEKISEIILVTFSFNFQIKKQIIIHYFQSFKSEIELHELYKAVSLSFFYLLFSLECNSENCFIIICIYCTCLGDCFHFFSIRF